MERQKNKVITIILIALISPTFASCQSGLTRSNAAEIIKQFYDYPNVESTEFSMSIGESWPQEYINRYKTLESMNLIIIDNQPQASGLNIIYPVHFTSSGIKYSMDNNQVITNIREFKEVTGISNIDEYNVKVEFSVSQRKITPFGSNQGRKDGDVENYSVTMKKYDNGWRITDQKQINYKASDYSNVFEN